MKPIILYVDDEPANTRSFTRCFDDELPVLAAGSAAEALVLLEREEIGVLVSDQRMPLMTGIELLEQATERWPLVSRMLLTAYSDRELLLSAIERGHVHDYVLKPWREEELRVRLDVLLQAYVSRRDAASAAQERDHLRLALDDARGFQRLVGLAPLADTIGKIAGVDSCALITGEPGTGKSLLAAQLHAQSTRHDGPFITLRCVDSDDALELRLRGRAATPTSRAVSPAFELARGGTLYLSRVDELSMQSQGLLVELIHESNRRGETRVIASATRSLRAESADGRFRPDLADLLSVHRLDLLPLRERGDDVIALARAFLDEQSARLRRRPSLSAEALSALRNHDWPGNVRELRNAIERAVVLADADAVLEPEDFLFEFVVPGNGNANVYDEIAQHEAKHLRAALVQAAGNKARAARALGIARSTLNDRLRKHGLY